MSLVAVDKFVVVKEKKFKKEADFRQQIFNRVSVLKYRYLGRFPSDFLPTPLDEIFALIIKQPRNMLGGYWILLAKICRKLCFADFLDLEKYSFLKWHYKQLLPEPLQSLPIVSRF